MNKDYLLVNKSILPKYYDDVIKAREMVDIEGASVTEACKACSISRSTYYKYHDLIFKAPEELEKKATLQFKVDDVSGVLSNIIKLITEEKCNVLSISQDIPIQKIANITIMIDVQNIKTNLNEMILNLKSIEHIKSVKVLGYE